MNGGRTTEMMHISGAMRNRGRGALRWTWFMGYICDASQELFNFPIIKASQDHTHELMFTLEKSLKRRESS